MFLPKRLLRIYLGLTIISGYINYYDEVNWFFRQLNYAIGKLLHPYWYFLDKLLLYGFHWEKGFVRFYNYAPLEGMGLAVVTFLILLWVLRQFLDKVPSKYLLQMALFPSPMILFHRLGHTNYGSLVFTGIFWIILHGAQMSYHHYPTWKERWITWQRKKKMKSYYESLREKPLENQ